MDNDIAAKILEKVTSLDQKVSNIDLRTTSLEQKVDTLTRSVLFMETDHTKKLNILLDMYPENVFKSFKFADRIENLEQISEKHSI